MKEKVLSVTDTGRKTQNGATIYQVVTNNEQRPVMTAFSKRTPEYLHKEIEEGVDFTVKSSEYQGKMQHTINFTQKDGGGFQKGGGKFANTEMMNRAYAKDIVCEFIKLGKIDDPIDAARLVLDIEANWKSAMPLQN